MMEKPDATHTLGLDLSSRKLRAAFLSSGKKGPKLEKVYTVDVSQDELGHVKPLYTQSQGSDFKQAAQKQLIVTAVSTQEVLARPLEIKLKKIADIDAALAFQAEPLIPYPIEEAALDRIVLASQEESSLLTVLAAKKEHLEHHIHLWQSLYLEPEVIASVPSALATFSSLFSSLEDPHFTLYLGEDSTTCILVEEGKLIAAQSVPKGILGLIEAAKKDGIEEQEALTLETCDPEQTPHLDAAFQAQRIEITKLIFALTKQIKGRVVEDILVTGVSGQSSLFVQQLLSSLNKNLITPSPHANFPLSTQELQSYAIPIGLALSCLPKQKHQVNFRQQEFAYPNPWKRVKKPVISYLFLSVLFAAAFYLFGTMYVGYHEDLLKTYYTHVLAAIKKPYESFEIEYNTKQNPASDFGPEDIVSVQELTQEDILQRIDFLLQELKQQPDTFPLFPNVPRVSDVLAWLANHPKARGMGDEGASSPRMSLENFSYKMVKRPETTKKQEKYQVKVEIEFTTPIPRYAREFHDALLEPNEIIDPDSEIKWTSNRGKYKATFYLKDRTKYPTKKRRR